MQGCFGAVLRLLLVRFQVSHIPKPWAVDTGLFSAVGPPSRGCHGNSTHLMTPVAISSPPKGNSELKLSAHMSQHDCHRGHLSRKHSFSRNKDHFCISREDIHPPAFQTPHPSPPSPLRASQVLNVGKRSKVLKGHLAQNKSPRGWPHSPSWGPFSKCTISCPARNKSFMGGCATETLMAITFGAFYWDINCKLKCHQILLDNLNLIAKKLTYS